MEIIKNGADVSMTHRCDVCGCEFRFQPGEVNHEAQEMYDVPMECWKKHGGDYGPCRVISIEFVICPCCKMKCYL
jgi:hypothetical protein